jgi:hypothetical protein
MNESEKGHWLPDSHCDNDETGTILSEEWMAAFLVEAPDYLEGITLEMLSPDRNTFDRLLVEMIILRDRLRGIEHPEMAGKLTAPRDYHHLARLLSEETLQKVGRLLEGCPLEEDLGRQ